MMCGPTPRLSRAAERAMIKRHGHVKEKMFQNRRWRRRLQALLGRDIADDGPSARPTGNTAGTSRSPTRAGTHRDAIRRRTLRHTIRRRAIPHATDLRARDPAPASFARDRLYGTRSGDRHCCTRPNETRSGEGRYGTRRPFPTPCPATDHTARDEPFLPDDV